MDQVTNLNSSIDKLEPVAGKRAQDYMTKYNGIRNK